ncbi:UNVERIFIED_CONTAM: hypothetical protein FKN15_062864 [Acipenser sinensis]
MEVAGKWLFDPSTLQWLKMEGRKHLGTVQLPPEVRGKYPALEEALNVMNKVAGRIQRERWEVEQSQLAWAGAAMCSICMEYGHVEANCHEREEDWDTDLEWCTNCLCYGHEEDRCLEVYQDMDLEWEEPERPSPKRGEPKGPSPKRGEDEHPQPKQGTTCHSHLHRHGRNTCHSHLHH